MVVRIRLTRFGKKRQPFYNIVVANARTARNSKPLEVLGTFDPIPQPPSDGEGRPSKQVRLDVTRAKYWLGVGAQPSDPAWKLLAMVGIIEPKLSDRIRRERAAKMDAIYRGDTSPGPLPDESPDESPEAEPGLQNNEGETTEEMLGKLQSLQKLY